MVAIFFMATSFIHASDVSIFLGMWPTLYSDHQNGDKTQETFLLLFLVNNFYHIQPIKYSFRYLLIYLKGLNFKF